MFRAHLNNYTLRNVSYKGVSLAAGLSGNIGKLPAFGGVQKGQSYTTSNIDTFKEAYRNIVNQFEYNLYKLGGQSIIVR
jgi:hypothetical protein